MQEPASPSTAEPLSRTCGGLEPFVDLNTPTPELRDDAHFAPAHPARARSDTYVAIESLVDLNAPTPSELRDDADMRQRTLPELAKTSTLNRLLILDRLPDLDARLRKRVLDLVGSARNYLPAPRGGCRVVA
ncbi:hypothetical protein [Bradyrhizobium sp. CCBAU 65884]|uniref:hypothetical protein n=1 Tax=Bradyrhizobium sp. CCBAU 65884 TaxID=722477 RepID=UPI002304E450|nr:hypothetical protein [Bradyrhizobium sp. CCBAU 65884]